MSGVAGLLGDRVTSSGADEIKPKMIQEWLAEVIGICVLFPDDSGGWRQSRADVLQ